MPTFTTIDGVSRELTGWPVMIGGVSRELDSMMAAAGGVQREIFSLAKYQWERYTTANVVSILDESGNAIVCRQSTKNGTDTFCYQADSDVPAESLLYVSDGRVALTQCSVYTISYNSASPLTGITRGTAYWFYRESSTYDAYDGLSYLDAFYNATDGLSRGAVDDDYQVKLTYTKRATIAEGKGSMIDVVRSADPSAYPENGKHTDGYWYVKIS